jgi:hypothetical protein
MGCRTRAIGPAGFEFDRPQLAVQLPNARQLQRIEQACGASGEPQSEKLRCSSDPLPGPGQFPRDARQRDPHPHHAKEESAGDPDIDAAFEA